MKSGKIGNDKRKKRQILASLDFRFAESGSCYMLNVFNKNKKIQTNKNFDAQNSAYLYEQYFYIEKQIKNSLAFENLMYFNTHKKYTKWLRKSLDNARIWLCIRTHIPKLLYYFINNNLGYKYTKGS